MPNNFSMAGEKAALAADKLGLSLSKLNQQVQKLNLANPLAGQKSAPELEPKLNLKEIAKWLGLTTTQLKETTASSVATVTSSAPKIKPIAAHKGLDDHSGSAKFTAAMSGLKDSLNAYASMALAIPQLAEQAMGMVDQILNSWGEIGSKVGKWMAALPQAVMNALAGLPDIFFTWFENIFLHKLDDKLLQAVVSGVRAALNTLSGKAPRGQSQAQTKALKGFVKSIGSWITHQNRKNWGFKDWSNEYKRLETKKLGLDMHAANYWKQYIKLGKQQFATLQKIQATSAQAASTLKGVLGTLQSTLDQITGSAYNPKGVDMKAQAARFAGLLKAAQETGISARIRQTRVGALTQFSTKYLGNAKAQFRSSSDYQNVYKAVVDGLKGVKTLVSGDLAGVVKSKQGLDVMLTAKALKTQTQTQIKTVDGGTGPFAMMIQWLNKIWKMLLHVDGALRALLSIFQALYSLLSGAWHNLIQMVQFIWDTLKSIPQALFDMLKGMWDQLWKAVAAMGTVFYQQIRKVFDPAVNVLKKIRDLFADLPKSIANAFKSAISGGGAGGRIGGRIIGGLSSAWHHAFSDRQLKTNIQQGQELLPGVRASNWSWNAEGNKLGLFGQGFGVIAQDLEKILPSLVHQVGRFKQVDYAGLSSLFPQISSFLPGYAEGGISYGPQLAWVSEGQHAAEAHVPLPNGKSIPVEFTNPATQGDKEVARLLKEVSGKLDQLTELNYRTGALVDLTRSRNNPPPVVVDLGSLESNLSRLAAERGQRGNLQFSGG